MLRQLMNRTFGEGYYNSNSLLETKQYLREEVSEIIRCHPWLRGFSDHKLSLNLPFDSQHAEVFALCFVRDPVERFISRFQFHRNFEEVNCIAQRMSFREFAHAELVEKHVHPQTNSQIYFLNGGIDDRNLDPVHSALATGKTFLFPIEQFDQACVCLEQRFPETFVDLSYVKVNTSTRRAELDAADREFVSERLRFDLPICELASQQLEEALSVAFPSGEDLETAMEDFKDRCSRRYHNFRPLRDKDEPLLHTEDIANDQSTNRPAHLRPGKSG